MKMSLLSKWAKMQNDENVQIMKTLKCENAQLENVNFYIKTQKHDSLWEAWYPLETSKPEKRRTRRLGNHKVSILPIYLSFWAFLGFFDFITFFTFLILILSLFDFFTFCILSLFLFFAFSWFSHFYTFDDFVDFCHFFMLVINFEWFLCLN